MRIIRGCITTRIAAEEVVFITQPARTKEFDVNAPTPATAAPPADPAAAVVPPADAAKLSARLCACVKKYKGKGNREAHDELEWDEVEEIRDSLVDGEGYADEVRLMCREWFARHPDMAPDAEEEEECD